MSQISPPEAAGAVRADSPGEKVFAIGQALRSLDPGALADLRRLDLERKAWSAPMFWRLVVEHNLSREKEWAAVIQMMATLTQKGRDETKASPHDAKNGFGRALCDGGQVAWGSGIPREQRRPVFAEARLARLLVARGETRIAMLARAVRMIARTKDPTSGIDCRDLQKLVFGSGSGIIRKIARDYYSRLDGGAPADAFDESSP